MSDQQIYENMVQITDLLLKLEKKVDKLTNIVTKMGKALHLIPVSEKEERDLQLLQRTHLANAAKVSAELDAMSPPKEPELPEMLTVFDNFEQHELFNDVLGDDFLGGVKNG